MMNKFNDIKNEAKEKINQLTKKNKGNNDKIIESPEQNQNLVNANEFKEFSLPIDPNEIKEVEDNNDECLIEDLVANENDDIPIKKTKISDKVKKIKENFIEKGENMINKISDKKIQMKEKVNIIKQEVNEKIKKEKEKLTIIKNNIMGKGTAATKSIENNIKIRINEAEDKLKIKMDKIKTKIIEELKNIDAKFLEILHKEKKKINKFIRLKIEKIILKILTDKARPLLKKKLKDPEMCKSVQHFIDDLVDELFPGIIEEVQLKLRLLMEDPYVEIQTSSASYSKFNIFCHGIKCFQKFRGWYLYTTNPYNKSIWAQFKWVSWWFFLLASMFPYYGVQPFFFAFVFLMIDKSDEYQLVKYILDFKKMIFFTAGVTNGMIGYVLYFICATLNEYKDLDDYRRCLVIGPGSEINYLIDLTSFFLQIVLVWLSFLLLPFSKPKGKPKFIYFDEEKPEDNVNNCCCCHFVIERGGRLKKFMIYDIIIAGIAIGIFFIFYFLFDIRDDEHAKGIIFFCKIIYGLLSFPFLIFAIPILSGLLTKARTTGYDRSGNCVTTLKVKFKFKEQESKKSLDEELEFDIMEAFDEKAE